MKKGEEVSGNRLGRRERQRQTVDTSSQLSSFLKQTTPLQQEIRRRKTDNLRNWRFSETINETCYNGVQSLAAPPKSSCFRIAEFWYLRHVGLILSGETA